MGKPVKIEVQLDAPNLCTQGNVTDAEIIQNVDMWDDNNGCTPGGDKLKDYMSMVYLGELVEWTAKVKNQTDPVAPYRADIDRIAFKSGSNIFGVNYLDGINGKVTAKVLSDADFGNTLYLYSIEVSIYLNNTKCQEIIIDPKLQANTN